MVISEVVNPYNANDNYISTYDDDTSAEIIFKNIQVSADFLLICSRVVNAMFSKMEDAEFKGFDITRMYAMNTISNIPNRKDYVIEIVVTYKNRNGKEVITLRKLYNRVYAPLPNDVPDYAINYNQQGTQSLFVWKQNPGDYYKPRLTPEGNYVIKGPKIAYSGIKVLEI